MKIDLSPAAVRLRLEQVEALRRLCLSLARSSAGRQVMEKHPADENVKRTAAALGRYPEEGVPASPGAEATCSRQAPLTRS